MDWWKRWKAKHWDEQVFKNDPGSPVFFIGLDKPPLRRIAAWFAKHWREQPLNSLMTVIAILGLVVSIIQLLR
ncbi:hypothetical protein [Delftia acidovorans]|uniref:hypothetical protein n=1 Tax=Delftia acidovorans TaxID=80866 RepID=UPI001EDEF737|nr:hypothetical protein [Delftia acidovorans]MCG3782749.1 hypothetical protein [Delftia acidovorans]